MKATILAKQDIEIAGVGIKVPVRYEEEDIPNDFPLRTGKKWEAFVHIDTGQIRDWPQGKSGRLQMKVCDEGSYYLYDRKGSWVAAIKDDYVPHGVITNWPKHPDVSAFFPHPDND